jgi:methionyl-tRNA formyltransferase
VNVVFAGTPDFASRHLQSLVDDDFFTVIAVYTQPDRPAGRGKKIIPSSVKETALANGISVFQPVSLKDPKEQQVLAQLNPDVMVVVAYGLILPPAVLAIPKLGCINVHGSELPRWRGAAPIQRAIEAGDTNTGVTVMQMDAGLDTGPMLDVARCAIETTDTSATLYNKLAGLGTSLLPKVLKQLDAGTAVKLAQREADSTYAQKIDKQEALVDWRESVSIIDQRIRAFNPAPVCYSMLEGQRIKIWAAIIIDCDSKETPGKILSASSDGLVIQCGQGRLLVRQLQMPGKSKLPVNEILKSRASLFKEGKTFGG